MLIIGIDPGLSGGIATVDGNGALTDSFIMPILKVGKGREINTTAFMLILHDIKPTHVILEVQQPFKGQGLTSTGKTMRNYGILEGILIGQRIPYTPVRPQEWQREMFSGMGKGGDSKGKSALVAMRLWPEYNWHITEGGNPGAKNPHDGLTDAANMAEYGRRKLR